VTLLEVVVAVVIAALALIGLFRGGVDGLLAADIAAAAEEAVQRAESHLAAVGGHPELVVGEFTDDDGGGYRWSLRVAPADRAADRDRPTRLFAVEVVISWRGRQGPRQVGLRTMRLGLRLPD
jgi:general secretion pathway protein I